MKADRKGQAKEFYRERRDLSTRLVAHDRMETVKGKEEKKQKKTTNEQSKEQCSEESMNMQAE